MHVLSCRALRAPTSCQRAMELRSLLRPPGPARGARVAYATVVREPRRRRLGIEQLDRQAVLGADNLAQLGVVDEPALVCLAFGNAAQAAQAFVVVQSWHSQPLFQ